MINQPLPEHFDDLTLSDSEVVAGFVDRNAPALQMLLRVVFVDVGPLLEYVHWEDGADDVVDLEVRVVIKRILEVHEPERTDNPGLNACLFLDFANNRFGNVFVAFDPSARELSSATRAREGLEDDVEVLALVLAPDDGAGPKDVPQRKLFVDGEGLVGNVGFNVFDF